MKIIIPGNAIAKKNSQKIARSGRRQWIRPSSAYEVWEKTSLQYLLYSCVPFWPGSYPVELRLFFYRKTKAKFDLSNMIEGVQDVLQKAGVLVDDSMVHVIPVIDRRGDDYGWTVDKENPRIEISIEPIKQKNGGIF